MSRTKITALAIDPGNKGAFVEFDGTNFQWWPMPTETNGKDISISYDGVYRLLDKYRTNLNVHVYLERAVPMAMGSKHAFNYGRGFQSLVIAIESLGLPHTYVEPSKWAKEMHEGVSADLKAKAKSLIAAQRLFPKIVKSLPRNKKGAVLDGPIDALLIAAYGLRKGAKPATSDDFY